MIYGLYLSASGVLANSYRQDVIANNLANAETVGFKRSLALFRQRPTEAQESGNPNLSHPTLDAIGGGMLLAPTVLDRTQGRIEKTSSNLDVAIFGSGYFAVEAGNESRLTRNGQFMINREGYLILADGSGHRVLDAQRQPIALAGLPASQLTIGADGTIAHKGQPVARLGIFDVPDPSQLLPHGGTLLSHPAIEQLPPAATATLQSGFVENSNVDPMTELTQLINAQRQLEANANMIRYQDQTLGKLVNEVGKIG